MKKNFIKKKRMYKVKRFSQTSEFEKFVNSSIPKKMNQRGGFEVSDDDNLFASLASTQKSNLKSMLKNLPSIAKDEITKYEKKAGKYSIANEADDFYSLLDDLYVFGVELQGGKSGVLCSVSVSGRGFEDWMGWYDIVLDIQRKKVDDVIYAD